MTRIARDMSTVVLKGLRGTGEEVEMLWIEAVDEEAVEREFVARVVAAAAADCARETEAEAAEAAALAEAAAVFVKNCSPAAAVLFSPKFRPVVACIAPTGVDVGKDMDDSKDVATEESRSSGKRRCAAGVVMNSAKMRSIYM